MYAPAAANLGCAYLDQGKYTHAQAALEDAIQANTGYAVAYNNLGVVLLRLGQYTPAAAQFAEAVRQEPHYTDPYLHLALLWKAQGDHERMQRAWQD